MSDLLAKYTANCARERDRKIRIGIDDFASSMNQFMGSEINKRVLEGLNSHRRVLETLRIHHIAMKASDAALRAGKLYSRCEARPGMLNTFVDSLDSDSEFSMCLDRYQK